MFNFKVLVFVALVSIVYGGKFRKSPYVGILGGSPIDISKVPYMAYFYDKHDGLFCGGSIVSKRYVLTAAHCFKYIDLSEDEISVVVGTNLPDGSGEVYEIEEAICNPDFDPVEVRNDVCLIKVATPIKFGSNVAKIDLVDEYFGFETGLKLEVTGWGQTEPYGDLSDQLMQVTVPYVTRSVCEDELGLSEITMSEMCAGESGKDTCAGDSGGPLTFNNKVVVGITSYGIGDCGRRPGVYANVQYLLPWIRKTMGHQYS